MHCKSNESKQDTLGQGPDILGERVDRCGNEREVTRSTDRAQNRPEERSLKTQTL